jgi:predicted nucleic acid-binding protein
MIALDTNVLSEPLKQRPDERVLDWLEGLEDEAVITAVTAGELLTGVRALPDGRRRTDLLEAIELTLNTFSGSVLPYDDSAARRYALLQETRRLTGRPLAVEDGMIAAICITRGAALATRNTTDFDGLGLETVDPWSDAW